MARLLTICILVALGLGLGTAEAGAQPQGPAARAEALFKEASADLDAGKYASACKKLEEVTTLLPEAIGARETLGECYEKSDKLGSAFKQYWKASELSLDQRNIPRAKEDERKAAQVKRRAAALVVDIDATTKSLPGLVIAIDGQPMSPLQLGLPVPVDSGERELTVSAPGYGRFNKRWTAVNGDQARVTVAPLQPKSDAPAGEAGAGGTGPSPPEGPASDSDTSSKQAGPRPWQLPLGLTAIGVGLAGIGAGVGLGVLAIEKNNASNAGGHCDPSGCDDTGFALRTDALAFGNGSTVAFVAGGVLLAGGVVLAISAPRRAPESGQKASARPRADVAITARFVGPGLSIQGSF